MGGLDLMATFASVAGVKLPDKDREGQPIIFDSYDMSPLLFGTGKCARKSWFYSRTPCGSTQATWVALRSAFSGAPFVSSCGLPNCRDCVAAG